MYVLHEVAFSTSENRDEQRIQFPGGPSNVLGRCFVEVSLRGREREREIFHIQCPLIISIN